MNTIFMNSENGKISDPCRLFTQSFKQNKFKKKW